MDQRDWVFMGIGLGLGFFLFTAIGQEAIKTGAGVTKSEARRLLKKVQKRTEARAKL